MSNPPRFIADAMLGSLAKWLRILGFDTLYFRDIDDHELIKIARQEQRILLTRDTGITGSRKIDNFVLIKSNVAMEQLKEVLKDLVSVRHWSLSFAGPRCAECNGGLAPADRQDVTGDVPEHVFLNFNSFFRCPDCGKVYWEGSHKKLMDEKILGVLAELGLNWKNSERN